MRIVAKNAFDKLYKAYGGDLSKPQRNDDKDYLGNDPFFTSNYKKDPFDSK